MNTVSFILLRNIQGVFHNGVMHGKGQYTWKDGVVYEVFIVRYLMRTSLKLVCH